MTAISIWLHEARHSWQPTARPKRLRIKPGRCFTTELPWQLGITPMTESSTSQEISIPTRQVEGRLRARSAFVLDLRGNVPAIVDQHHFRQQNGRGADPEQQTSRLLIGLARKAPIVYKRICDVQRIEGSEVRRTRPSLSEREKEAGRRGLAFARRRLRNLFALAVAFLLVLFHDRSCGYFLGALAVASTFLRGFLDVFVLALLLGANAAQMFFSRH
jgi:hypothetical protein